MKAALRRCFCATSARIVNSFLSSPISRNRSRVQLELESLFSVNFYNLKRAELFDIFERVGEIAFTHRGEDKASKLGYKLVAAILFCAGEGFTTREARKILSSSYCLRIFNASLFALIRKAFYRDKIDDFIINLVPELDALLFFCTESAECLELFDFLAQSACWTPGAAVSPLHFIKFTHCLLMRELVEALDVSQNRSSLKEVVSASESTASLQLLHAALLQSRNRLLSRHSRIANLFRFVKFGEGISKYVLNSYLKLAPLLFPELLKKLKDSCWDGRELPAMLAEPLQHFYTTDGKVLLELGLAALPLTQKMANFFVSRLENSDFVRYFSDNTIKINCNEKLFYDLLCQETKKRVEQNVLRYIYEIDLVVDGKHSLEIDSHIHSLFLLTELNEKPLLRPCLAKFIPKLVTLRFMGLHRFFSFIPAECYQRARVIGQQRPEEHIYENILCVKPTLK